MKLENIGIRIEQRDNIEILYGDVKVAWIDKRHGTIQYHLFDKADADKLNAVGVVTISQGGDHRIAGVN